MNADPDAVKHRLPWIAVAVAWFLGGYAAQASNLLVNPGFEANSGHVIPTGWTYFSPPTTPPGYFGNYWVESASGVAHSGSLYWKEWGALYQGGTNNVAGIYQDFSSTPGAVYQASGWFYTLATDALGTDCRVWVEVSFLGAANNVLALYKTADFTTSAGTSTWMQYAVTNACDVSAPIPSGDAFFTTYAVTGSVSQLTAPAGTTKVRYRFAYLQVGSQGGSCYFDDAVLDQTGGAIAPVISNLLPQNMIFVNPADGVSFNVTSPSGFTINNSAIHLVLNGTDVSGSLVIGGSASSKTVSYHGLQSNLTYTASITVTDSFNLSASANTYFETTWVGISPVLYLWEAEDFDFNGGSYINNPDLCSTNGNPNCYFGKVGVEGVDEHSIGTGGSFLYRPADAIRTSVAGDYLRKNLFTAGRLDYRIDPFQGGEWVNYTRDWPSGTYWVIGRLATGEGLSGTLTLSKVNPDTSVTDLGTFTIDSGLGWSSFQNISLKDTNGNLAVVTLNGKTTLRITSGGNLLPNFFALAPAQVDLPVISNLYPTGTRPFEYTNALSFALTTSGATFPPNGIKLTLDGVDVSSSLVLGGSVSNRTVLYASLLPNAVHTAVITATNSLGHGILVSNRFDTFNQTNYMVEAEDFDFDAGQYVSSWFPDAYQNLAATTNIDFQHTTLGGEQFPYRFDGIPEEIAFDYLRQSFIDVGAIDYHLAWYGIGDWANYTRAYPSGTFYVYARSAGFGPYTMYLDKIISGAGTANQTTQRLGRWDAVGRDNRTHDWVPLTDNGLIGPMPVKLGGVGTLRITTPTGNCHPNYLMLIPAGGLKVNVGRVGNNINLSFATQPGSIYRVFYRNDLNGAWQLLTTVTGDGTVKTVSDPASVARRFYQVVTP